ncbi:MAG: hypothetical protein AAGH64_07865 [Planctomycetota bacterium]
MQRILATGAVLAIGVPALAGFANIDFSVEDDFLTPLVNGQEINATGANSEFGNLFTITSSRRLAIFDTSNPGPNAGGGDADLLVNQGNALIIQNRGKLTQSTADVFDEPNDFANGGNIFFNFVNPAELSSVDLIDVDDANGVTVTLTDDQGRTRVYDVPNSFTNEVNTDGPAGFDTLSLTDVLPQAGEGVGIATLASEDAGYDATRVMLLEVDFAGSGGLDNLIIDSVVPTPGAVALMGLSGLATVRRRRRG